MAVEVVMPRLSDSMDEATVLEWHVAEGEEVRRGQPLAEIETDKATMTFEADTDGILLRIVCGAGESASLGTTIAVIGEPGEQAPDGLGEDETAAPPVPVDPVTQASPVADITVEGSPPPTSMQGHIGHLDGRSAPANGSATGRVAASPVARRAASTLGIDLAGVRGTGPGGRVVRSDVEAVAARSDSAAPAPAEPQPPVVEPARIPAPAELFTPAPADEAETAHGAVEVFELSRLQKVVARRMADSRATVPDFELRVDVDMGAASEMREALRELGADPLPSFNDMIVKAAARGLREFPRVNGAYRDGTIETYSRINVGVAVAAEDALVVPVVTDVDRRTLGDVASRTRALAEKVRDGTITPPELAGGTFTVSNLGMFGIDSFTAVINVPQAAILAVGAVAKRAVAGPGDEVVVRPMMTLTLACDHRVLYGADGARFLARLRELLEQPLSFVL